jgi:hypothetical protein
VAKTSKISSAELPAHKACRTTHRRSVRVVPQLFHMVSLAVERSRFNPARLLAVLILLVIGASKGITTSLGTTCAATIIVVGIMSPVTAY